MGRASRTAASQDGAGPRPHHLWPAAAVVLLLAGVVAAVLSAQDVARTEADQSLQSFEHRASHVAATLQLALLHQDDLVVDAGGLAIGPSMSRTDFRRWADGARVWERYPEMAAIGGLVLVSVSIGIAIATGGRETADELLCDADLALYQAKKAGRNRYATYEPPLLAAPTTP